MFEINPFLTNALISQLPKIPEGIKSENWPNKVNDKSTRNGHTSNTFLLNAFCVLNVDFESVFSNWVLIIYDTVTNPKNKVALERFQPFNTWFLLKGHAYLNNHASFFEYH